jgi:signal transduction histidine kinase
MRAVAQIMSDYRTHFGAAVPDSIRQAEERIDIDYTLGNLDRLLQSTRQGLDRLREIVANLRDFSRLDEADRKAIMPNDAVRSSLEMVRYLVRQKNIQVECDLGDLPLLWCFAGKLNQVLVNILINAIQAVPEKGTIRLATRTNADRTEVQFLIADNGPGIPEETVVKIFDPFFTTKPQGVGTGLGLWISYNIVKEHGGRIDVTTALGEGTTFTITLPHRMPSDLA